jgi:LmbE family N-acetylglucosaminyl deacetylase
MGGTLALLAKAGHDIQIVVTTTSSNAGTRRKEEILAVTALLGIRPPVFFDQPELCLEVSGAVEDRLFCLVGSDHDAVFTLWSIDVHPDHRNTAALVIGRFLRKGINTELYAMETCSAGRSSPAIRPQSLAFRPTHYVDVSAVLHAKQAMLRCHVSQDPDGMWRGAMSMMRNRGDECGATHAEAFTRLTRTGVSPQWIGELLRPTPWKLPRGIAADFDPSSIGLG